MKTLSRASPSPLAPLPYGESDPTDGGPGEGCICVLAPFINVWNASWYQSIFHDISRAAWNLSATTPFDSHRLSVQTNLFPGFGVNWNPMSGPFFQQAKI